MNTKPWWQSKTVWVNTLATIASLLVFMTDFEWVQEYPTLLAGLGVALGIVNVILRAVTTNPIGLRGSK